MRQRLITLVSLLVSAMFAMALLARIVSAQAGKAEPRRVTSDGHSTPIAWDSAGLLVARPGQLLGGRVANEWWRIAPADGSAQLISADAPSSAPARTITSAKKVFVVNGETLQPELWLADANAGNARLLLTGESEYFFAPALSPDGARFVFTRAPSGSETHAFSSIWLGDVASGDVKHLITEASSPVWSPDGNELAFEHRGDTYIGDWRLAIRDWNDSVASRQSPVASPQSLTPPATIRVVHMQGNYDFSQMATCRPPTLTVGTIITFPFEAYVSYVVPIESSPSNPPEQLKAQSLAARTYAWGRINPTASYDVSDWTDTQAMCDLRADSRSTAAVNATAGQYIAYGGSLISALYSAESGDPTRACPFGGGCNYLKAVDDPVSFGRTRNGHGGGMSQNGAYRWAQWYKWDYIQILTHYYSNVTIEGTTAFGGFVLPWNNGYVTSNRVRILGEASNGSALNIFARAQGLTTTQIATNTLLTSLDLTTVPDQPLGGFVVTGTISSTQASTLTLGIDRVPPTGTLTAPGFTLLPTVTLQLSATDSGSGFAGYGLSNHWIWEGEDKSPQYIFNGVGSMVTDSQALNGRALFASSGSSIIWFGPYTFDVPLGHPYRAYFRLKTNNVMTTSQIAKLDVVGDGVTPIGIKRVFGTDFRAANQYQEFFVDFNDVVSPTMGLEFRVDSEGALPADLYLDRVLVATYPVTSPLTANWTLSAPSGLPQIVIAKFSDNAGNVSADVTATVALSAPLHIYLPLLRR